MRPSRTAASSSTTKISCLEGLDIGNLPSLPHHLWGMVSLRILTSSSSPCLSKRAQPIKLLGQVCSLSITERIRRRGRAAMSSPQATQYDSSSFTLYGLVFRTEDGWL